MSLRVFRHFIPRSRGGPGTRGAPGRGAGVLVAGAGGVTRGRRAVDAGSFGRLTGGELGMARPGRRRMCVQDCRRMGPTVPFGRGEMCVAASGATGAPGKSGRDPARHVSARPPSLAAPFTIAAAGRGCCRIRECKAASSRRGCGGAPRAGSRPSAVLDSCGLARPARLLWLVAHVCLLFDAQISLGTVQNRALY